MRFEKNEIPVRFGRGFLLFTFVIQDFFCDIDGAVFGLLEGAAHIFADDTDAEQLDTAQQQDQNDDGGITGNINAPKQFFDDNRDQIQ